MNDSSTNNKIESFVSINFEQSIEPKEPLKYRLKRRYFTRSLWVISIIVCLIMIVLKPNNLWIQFSCLFILSLTALFNLMSFYAIINRRYFSIDALISVTLSFIIVICKFIIIIFDIGLVNRKGVQEAKGIKDFISPFWISVYWTSIIFNCGFVFVQTEFWKHGHPNFFQRGWQTIKSFKLVVFIGVPLILLVAVLLTIYFFFSKDLLSLMEFFKNIILSVKLINIFSFLILTTILFGIGLVYLPLSFWKYTDSVANLQKYTKEFMKFKENVEKRVNLYDKDRDFFERICNRMIKVYNCPVDIIYYCQFVLNFIKNHQSYTHLKFNDFIMFDSNIDCDLNVKQGQDLLALYSVDDLSENFVKLKQNYYYSLKNKIMLFYIYFFIRYNSETYEEKTIFYNNDKVKEKIHKRNLEVGGNRYYIFPKSQNRALVISTKLIGIVLMFFSLVFYLLQWLPIICRHSKFTRTAVKKFFYSDGILSKVLVMIIFFYFSFIFSCSYYALTKFKYFDDYTLVPHHSDKFTMIKNSSLVNQIFLGILYSFIFLMSTAEVNKDSGDDEGSQILKYFNDLGSYPFIREFFIILVPLLLTVVAVIAAMVNHGYKFKFLLGKFVKYEDDLDFKEENKEVIKDGKKKDKKIPYLADEKIFHTIEKFEEVFYEEIQLENN